MMRSLRDFEWHIGFLSVDFGQVLGYNNLQLQVEWGLVPDWLEVRPARLLPGKTGNVIRIYA